MMLKILNHNMWSRLVNKKIDDSGQIGFFSKELEKGDFKIDS